jgi:hypothetical protein
VRSLYELRVAVSPPDDAVDHTEILIEPTLIGGPLEEFGEPTDEELKAAGTAHVATLGRLAAGLTIYMDDERKRHNCARGGPDPWSDDADDLHWWDSCHISVRGALSLADEELWQPWMTLAVPPQAVQAWLRRIKSGLAKIAAGV